MRAHAPDLLNGFLQTTSLYLVSVPPLMAPVLSPPDYCSHSTRLLAATTLRNVLGTKNLGDILSEREIIANEMQEPELSKKFREIVHNIRIWPNLGAFQKEECLSNGLIQIL